ncbi:MAG: hypothetical protein J0H87_04310 [Holosporales bacterium]|nr:hypothetical protein [Holosporales bacterium]
MLKKFFKNKWLKRCLLVLSALLLSVLSIAFHRGTLQAKIPIDYTEDPYAINMPKACQ